MSKNDAYFHTHSCLSNKIIYTARESGKKEENRKTLAP